MIYVEGAMPSHTQAGCVYMSARILNLTFSLADRGGDRQTDRQTDRPLASLLASRRSVFADGRCGDLIQSESCTHVSLFCPGGDPAHSLLFFCATQLYPRKVLVECLNEGFYHFVLCNWILCKKMFDVLEYTNVIINNREKKKT